MMIKYEHLLGLEFNIETQNCYTLLRQLYMDNWQIDLPNYPCPNNWWANGLDLYARLAAQNGFEILHVHPRDWLPGDVITMAIQSSTGNHVAVVLDNGSILHHLVGQRSVVTPYGGMFRNCTVGAYRHKDVPKTSTIPTIDFRQLDLPPHILHRLAELEAAGATAALEIPTDG